MREITECVAARTGKNMALANHSIHELNGPIGNVLAVIVIVAFVFLSSFGLVLLPVTQRSSQSQNIKYRWTNPEGVCPVMVIVVLVFQSSVSLYVAQPRISVMGGEQAGTVPVLATITRDQRAREGQEVSIEQFFAKT